MPSSDCFSSHLTKCLLLHYLGKLEQAKWDKMQYFVGFISLGSAKADNRLWKIAQSFDRQLCQKYWCQKLLKSDSPFFKLQSKMSGMFFFRTRCRMHPRLHAVNLS